MSLIAQTLRLGDDELAFVDFARGRWGPNCGSIFFGLCQIMAQERSHRVMVPPAVIMRRPWDRRRIVGVKTDPWLYRGLDVAGGTAARASLR